MQNIKENIKENKTWCINAHLNAIHLTTNLKYLQTKYKLAEAENIDPTNE